MMSWPNVNCSSRKYGILIIASILLFLIIIIGSSVALVSLMSADEIQYDNPNQSQTDYFLECCNLGDLSIDNADYLVVSKSPHKSDSLMVLVFSGDVTDWWDEFVTYTEECTIRLPNNNMLSYTAEKRISPFVCAYRVSSQGEIKSILRVSNVSGEEIDHLEELNKTHDKESLNVGVLLDEGNRSDVLIGEDNMTEGAIRQLQKEIAFGEQDIVTFFSNGYLESIDIKTQKTAEMLFMCIRNCAGITDLTDMNLQPMALPIEINGQGMGTFREFYITYQETGQFICISFTPEDSERFQDYVMSLR